MGIGQQAALLVALGGVALSAQAEMRITEYLYSGTPGEFVEFTNVGATPIDMSGWSFDDDSRTPGTFDLSAFGVVAPGESVILTESASVDFRAGWRLCSRVKVVGGLSANLGRNDEINLYDASNTLVDRLTYGDQSFSGTIRTQDASGWVSGAGLGANDASAWTLASDGDTEASWTNLDGNVGSPGRSSHGSGSNPCGVRITEYMYSGGDGEFIEFTNLGPLPVTMAGWSFDDDSQSAGTVDLSAFGSVAVGESVVLTEAAASAFRTAWGLCEAQKVIGGLSTNLGRNDEINLYDAGDTLIDRLTYGDQNLPGTIRTQDASGWVSSSGVGANDASAWTLSSAGDSEQSAASALGDIGSPGLSSLAPEAFDPCPVVAGAPTIEVAATTTSRLSLPASGGGAIGAALSDPTDPAATAGIDFTLSDSDTALGALSVTAVSSDAAVVASGGLLLSGSDGTRNLQIVPTGVGMATISVTVDDGSHQASYTIDYRVTAASLNPATTRFHSDAADASAAVGIDADWMLIANDEDQVLRLYPRNDSGYPQGRTPLSDEIAPDSGPLALTDASGSGRVREVDIEAVARAGSRLYWIGSHSNNKDAEAAPNRRRLFATDLGGSGATTTLTYVDRYDYLREDLIAWDAANGHGLGANALGLAASAAEGTTPEASDGSGFNIEGMVMAPDGVAAYLAFRAPLQTTSSRDQALIIPVNELDNLVADGAAGSRAVGAASFGSPILLDLGGRAIRDIARNDAGYYLILAGPSASASGIAPADFRLFAWSGLREDAPQELAVDLTALAPRGSFEGIVEVPTAAGPGTAVQLIVDNGDTDLYGDGSAAKDQPNPGQRLFRSEWVTVTLPQLDGDNLPEAVEDGVPGFAGGAQGDGNGDGIPDSTQAYVASLPAVSGGCYFTVVVPTGYTLRAVAATAPSELPANVTFPCGVVGFEVGGLSSHQALPVTVIAHGLQLPDGHYFKQTVVGGMDEPGATVSVVGNATRFELTLADGDNFDLDGSADGHLTDPGGPAVVGPTEAVPGLQPWQLAGLALLLAAAVARRQRLD